GFHFVPTHPTFLFSCACVVTSKDKKRVSYQNLVVSLNVGWVGTKWKPTDPLGNLTNLVSLRLNNNPDLTGPLPDTLTVLSLNTFYFNSTDLCEPIDSPFQTWLGEISNLGSTGVRCETGVFVNCNVTDIPSSECEVLIAFYNSTDGDNWSNRSGWPLTNTACNWYGVTCSDVDGKTCDWAFSFFKPIGRQHSVRVRLLD
ncbi:hypothetical protein QUF54_03915, partial [Candidatus Marithioploca araucensis]|nr:hypothetical protein [Candidatus Marithioploca araucensis]